MDGGFEWLKIGASLLGGGAFGAIITNLVSGYRSRIQPVGKRIEVTPLFAPDLADSPLRPAITVSDAQNTYTFTNLFVADVQILNRGNKDFSSFSFGLTLSPGDSVVHAEHRSADRHHVASIASTPNPASPAAVLDCVLKPFNRGDVYSVKMFVIARQSAPGPIAVSSAEAIKFVDMPSLSETLAEIASSAALNVGPLQVRIR